MTYRLFISIIFFVLIASPYGFAQTSAPDIKNSAEQLGCGGFDKPIFPSSAGRDYKGTCWVAHVDKDKFTDKISCTIYPAGMKPGAYPFILFTKQNASISVSGDVDRYPGTSVMIRVDRNKSFTGEDGFISHSSVNAVLSQMSKGTTIHARYTEWPDDIYHDGETDAKGIDEAISHCRSIVK